MVVTYCDIVQPEVITTPCIQSLRPAFQAQLYKFTMETGVHFISSRFRIIIKLAYQPMQLHLQITYSYMFLVNILFILVCFYLCPKENLSNFD